MVHTLPDYTTKYRMVTVFGNIDNNELAARLGAIHNFDRRGNLVWMDDFEGTELKWDISETGAGADEYITNAESLYGDQSFYIITDDTSGNNVEMIRSLPLPVTSKLGLQVSFLSKDDKLRYDFRLHVYKTTNWYFAEIRYDDDVDKLQLRTGTSTWVDLATSLNTYKSYRNFNTLKFVIDTSTDKWVRVMFNAAEYDASAYDIWSGTHSEAPHIEVRLDVETRENATNETYIDGVIVTQNEP